jgi:Trk K+ transport system NAD-binding subunit
MSVASHREIPRQPAAHLISVITLERESELIPPLMSETVLADGAELIMLGSHDHRVAFSETFGKL